MRSILGTVVTRALLVTLALLAVATGARAQPRAYVFETDFTTGSFSGVDRSSRAPFCNVASAHSDARLRWFQGQVYIVNRFGADNITVLDGSSFGFIRQFSVGNGSNPYDIAVRSPTKAYVTRYESAELWIVNPNTGLQTGAVSLAAFADGDGIPEMDRMQMVGPLLFVSLQRVNRNAGFQPTDSSLVVVIDMRTDQLVDCDAVRPGVQGILLPATNPVTPFVLDVPRSRLYLGCVGVYGVNDGGIVAIDAAALTAVGMLAPEASMGGDVLDLVWGGESKAYAIVSDAGFNTSLVHWSPASHGADNTVYAPGGFSLADAEITPEGGQVWVCNSSFGAPGIRTFSTTTDTEVGLPIVCTLPPQGIAFDAATNLEVPLHTPGGRVALAAPSPNPARGTVRFGFTLARAGDASVEVLDVTGRRVQAWTLPAATAGAHEIAWDARDGSGAAVTAGLYRVRVRVGDESVSRSVVLVR